MLPPPTSFKDRLKTDDFLLGAFVFSTDAAIPEVYAAAGFDFVVVDTEHGLNDVQTTLGHLRSARAAGIHALVRVGPSMLGDVPRLLDAGCEGIMLPHFGLPSAGASEALRNTRYAPEGTRPTCTGVSAASFGTAHFPDYVKRANRDIVTLGLVEDRECVDDIDDLLGRREVELVMPGPGDLATSLGVPGQLLHPEVKAAVDTVFQVANKHGAQIGMYINSPAEIPEWHARGARFFILSIDLKWLGTSLKAAAHACRSQELCAK
jgi:2-keto-3-deoxy-L-rhamnonate aldolase RhmA